MCSLLSCRLPTFVVPFWSEPKKLPRIRKKYSVFWGWLSARRTANRFPISKIIPHWSEKYIFVFCFVSYKFSCTDRCFPCTKWSNTAFQRHMRSLLTIDCWLTWRQFVEKWSVVPLSVKGHQGASDLWGRNDISYYPSLPPKTKFDFVALLKPLACWKVVRFRQSARLGGRLRSPSEATGGPGYPGCLPFSRFGTFATRLWGQKQMTLGVNFSKTKENHQLKAPILAKVHQVASTPF